MLGRRFLQLRLWNWTDSESFTSGSGQLMMTDAGRFLHRGWGISQQRGPMRQMKLWKSRMFPKQMSAESFRIWKCSVQIRLLLIAYFQTCCHILMHGSGIGLGIYIPQLFFFCFLSPKGACYTGNIRWNTHYWWLTNLCDLVDFSESFVSVKICSVCFARLNKSLMLLFTLSGDCGTNRLTQLSFFKFVVS